MLRAIALYSPEADLGIEYAPDGRFTTESLYADIRRVVRVTEEAARAGIKDVRRFSHGNACSFRYIPAADDLRPAQLP